MGKGQFNSLLVHIGRYIGHMPASSSIFKNIILSTFFVKDFLAVIKCMLRKLAIKFK